MLCIDIEIVYNVMNNMFVIWVYKQVYKNEFKELTI